MKFRITSTECDWNSIVLDKYPCLKDFGFETCEETRERFVGWAIDENGKGIKQTEPYKVLRPYVNIGTLEDLISLMDRVGEDIVIQKYNDGLEIEIYDGYRE